MEGQVDVPPLGDRSAGLVAIIVGQHDTAHTLVRIDVRRSLVYDPDARGGQELSAQYPFTGSEGSVYVT